MRGFEWLCSFFVKSIVEFRCLMVRWWSLCWGHSITIPWRYWLEGLNNCYICVFECSPKLDSIGSQRRIRSLHINIYFCCDILDFNTERNLVKYWSLWFSDFICIVMWVAHLAASQGILRTVRLIFVCR